MNTLSFSSYHNQPYSSWKKHAYCFIWYCPWIGQEDTNCGLPLAVPISTKWGVGMFTYTSLLNQPVGTWNPQISCLNSSMSTYRTWWASSWVSPLKGGICHSLHQEWPQGDCLQGWGLDRSLRYSYACEWCLWLRAEDDKIALKYRAYV